MQSILRQFYHEGFAVLFCRKPVEFLEKKIKNKRAAKVLSVLIKSLYTLLMLALVAKLIRDEYFLQ